MARKACGSASRTRRPRSRRWSLASWSRLADPVEPYGSSRPTAATGQSSSASCSLATSSWPRSRRLKWPCAGRAAVRSTRATSSTPTCAPGSGARSKRRCGDSSPYPKAVAEVRVLARYQEGLIRDRTRLINRLRFLLSQYWPEFLAARAFAALDGDAVTALLAELPTPSAVRSKTPIELARFLAAQRYRRRPLERAEQILAAAQVGARPQEAVYGRLVAEVADELRALKQRIEALDVEIRDRFLLQPEAPIILSLPGMSHRTGPRFLAEVGALARFGSPDSLAAYAGLTPTLWQSGRSSGTHFLSRRCNLHLRQACWSAALGSLKTPASRRFYDRKRSEGKSHHQAVIALARTQLRVLWTMLRAGTLFSAERALEAA